MVYNTTLTGANRSVLYLDGKAQGTFLTWSDDTETSFRNETLYIGSRANSDSKYTGELDDIKITGITLTPAEFMKKRSYYGGTAIIIK